MRFMRGYRLTAIIVSTPQNAVEPALSRVRKITAAALAASPHRHNGHDMRAQTDAPDRIPGRGGDMGTRTHPNRSA